MDKRRVVRGCLAVLLGLCVLVCGCDDDDDDGGGDGTPISSGPVTYYLHLDGRILSESPPISDTGQTALVLAGMGPADWTVALGGNTVGPNYTYSVWAHAYKTTFRLDMILFQSGVETTLASWSGLTTSDPSNIVRLQGSAMGLVSATAMGDRLVFRITATGEAGHDGVMIGSSPTQPSSTTIVP